MTETDGKTAAELADAVAKAEQRLARTLTRIAALEDRLSRYRRHLVADQKALADARSAWAAAAAAESPASVEG